MKPIRKTKLVEVKVTDVTLPEFKFPSDLSELERGRVVSIEALKQSVFPKSPSSKLPVVVDAAFKNAFITLRTKGTSKDDINLYPLTSLDTIGNNGIPKEFDSLQINWSESKVVMCDQANLAVNTVFVFVITYETTDKC